MSRFETWKQWTINKYRDWLPNRLRVVVRFVLLFGATCILSLVMVKFTQVMTGWFAKELTVLSGFATRFGSFVLTLEGSSARVSKTVATGLIAAGYAVVQLMTLLTIEPLLRCGAQRWVLGYATLSAVIAGATYCQFHDLKAIEGMGSAAPLIVGLFYPAVLFRLLGKLDLSATEGTTNDVQQVHANVLAIVAAGIRRNSLRYWAYVSEVLNELDEDRLLRLLLGVLANPWSLKDKNERETAFKDAKYQLQMLHDSQQQEGAPQSAAAAEKPAEGIGSTVPGTAAVDQATAATSATAKQNQASTRWSKWDIVEMFHQLGSPELVLDAVEPEIEALWLIGRMPLGEQCQLALKWLKNICAKEDGEQLRKLICSVVETETTNNLEPPVLNSRSPAYDDARERIYNIIRRYATREFYDNIVCEYRRRHFRCGGFPTKCWTNQRDQSHCSGCDGSCPQCEDKKSDSTKTSLTAR